MNKANFEVREMAFRKNVPLYQIGNKLGYSESGFCRKMRYEMSEEDKKKALEAINQIVGEARE